MLDEVEECLRTEGYLFNQSDANPKPVSWSHAAGTSSQYGQDILSQLYVYPFFSLLLKPLYNGHASVSSGPGGWSL